VGSLVFTAYQATVAAEKQPSSSLCLNFQTFNSCLQRTTCLLSIEQSNTVQTGIWLKCGLPEDAQEQLA